jgi:23S rRNA pseudouridine1911/1915/1917 synthase
MGRAMDACWTVAEPLRLLEFLRRQRPDWKRTTLEQCIRGGRVEVDGAPQLSNQLLPAGAQVRLLERPSRELPTRVAGLFPILHQDSQLVAIDKPAGLLSVSTESERERTALALLRQALAGGGRPAPLWPVHRLDRETSGVLLFARTKAAQNWVQGTWEETRKCYLAVVEGRPREERGTIDQPLFEDPLLGVQVGAGPGSKAARTRYAVRASSRGRSLLEVELDSGRRHQIRVHLAWLGHPLVGDPRYGSRAPRMGLHALSLTVVHPGTDRPVTFEAAPPPAFDALFR